MRRYESESPADDHLNNQVISALRYANPDPQVELPVRTKVAVDGGKELLLFFAESIEAKDGTDRAVILEPGGYFAREVVAEFE